MVHEDESVYKVVAELAERLAKVEACYGIEAEVTLAPGYYVVDSGPLYGGVVLVDSIGEVDDTWGNYIDYEDPSVEAIIKAGNVLVRLVREDKEG